MNSENDIVRGCLVGGAVGDALGYAIEFLNERQIFSLAAHIILLFI